MEIRGKVQVKQPVYGDCILSHLAARSAYDFLCSMNVPVYTVPNEANAEDADLWNIEVDDVDRMKSVIKYLNDHPDVVTIFNGENEMSQSKDLAQLLQEGLDAAVKNKYSYIIIEWW